MPDEELRRYVLNFLRDIKELIGQGRLFFVERVKTHEGLIALGLTYQTAINEIYSLSIENYSAGPKPDQIHEGEMYYEFGKKIEEIEVYIKLEIRAKNGERAICMSFHPAERPVDYPFRKQ